MIPENIRRRFPGVVMKGRHDLQVAMYEKIIPGQEFTIGELLEIPELCITSSNASRYLRRMECVRQIRPAFQEPGYRGISPAIWSLMFLPGGDVDRKWLGAVDSEKICSSKPCPYFKKACLLRAMAGL